MWCSSDFTKDGPLLYVGKAEDESVSRLQLHQIFMDTLNLQGCRKVFDCIRLGQYSLLMLQRMGIPLNPYKKSVAHSKIYTPQMYDKRRFDHRESANLVVRGGSSLKEILRIKKLLIASNQTSISGYFLQSSFALRGHPSSH